MAKAISSGQFSSRCRRGLAMSYCRCLLIASLPWIVWSAPVVAQQAHSDPEHDRQVGVQVSPKTASGPSSPAALRQVVFKSGTLTCYEDHDGKKTPGGTISGRFGNVLTVAGDYCRL